MPGYINDLIYKVHKTVAINSAAPVNYLSLFMGKVKGKVNELFVD